MIDNTHTTSPLPDFGTNIAYRATPCSPAELYRALFLDLENNVHFIAPAFHFVNAALEHGELPASLASGAVDIRQWVAQLKTWARTELAGTTTERRDVAWLQHVVREFAPLGLS